MILDFNEAERRLNNITIGQDNIQLKLNKQEIRISKLEQDSNTTTITPAKADIEVSDSYYVGSYIYHKLKHAFTNQVSVGVRSFPANFTVYQSGTIATRGLLLCGISIVGGVGLTGGIIFSMGYFSAGTGNAQLWLSNSEQLGNSTYSSFRYVVGFGIPIIDAVASDGSVQRNMSFGWNNSSVGVGFDNSNVQSDIDAKLHVLGRTSAGNRLFYVTTSSGGAILFNILDNKKMGTWRYPSINFAFDPTQANVIGTDRNVVAAGAGFNFTVQGGGATSGSTDKAGGDLYLRGGVATGTGSSNIYLQTTTPGVTGTADRTPSTKVIIRENGTTTFIGSGQFTGNVAASSGQGCEIGGDGVNGIVRSYDRTGGAPTPLQLSASLIQFMVVGVEKARLHTNGYIGINNVAPSYHCDVGGDINTSGVFRCGGVAGIGATETIINSVTVMSSTLQYKDWAGANVSMTVVNLVTVGSITRTFTGGILTA